MLTRSLILLAVLVALEDATAADDFASAVVPVGAEIHALATIELVGEWVRATGPTDALTGVIRDGEWVNVPPDAWTYVGDGGRDALAAR